MGVHVKKGQQYIQDGHVFLYVEPQRFPSSSISHRAGVIATHATDGDADMELDNEDGTTTTHYKCVKIKMSQWTKGSAIPDSLAGGVHAFPDSHATQILAKVDALRVDNEVKDLYHTVLALTTPPPAAPEDGSTQADLLGLYGPFDASGGSSDPSASSSGGTAATTSKKVDQQIPKLTSVDGHDNWLLKLEKYKNTYSKYLEKEDLIYRVENAIKISNECSDHLATLTFTEVGDVLDALQAFLHPKKTQKKWDDFNALQEFTGSSRKILTAERDFRTKFEKIKGMSIDEVAGMLFLKGIGGTMSETEMQGLQRDLKGDYGFETILKEAKFTFQNRVEVDHKNGLDDVHFVRPGGKGGNTPNKSTGGGCINCGSKSHWLDDCKLPLSENAKKALKKAQAEKNKAEKDVPAGRKGGKKGKGKKGKDGKHKSNTVDTVNSAAAEGDPL